MIYQQNLRPKVQSNIYANQVNQVLSKFFFQRFL